MRTYEEYRQILALWERGLAKKRIAITLGLPKATVRDCIDRYGNIAGLEEIRQEASKNNVPYLLKHSTDAQESELGCHYAYLLGLYLGDGCISKSRTTYRLRIVLDKRYQGIIQSCIQAINAILPDNVVGTVPRSGCFDVSCYSNHWPDVFPQHGGGSKHQRQIKLADWQQQIVDGYPLAFFRGLYHSDGSRFSNVVNGKDYPRYSFTNASTDILDLFTQTCDKLGIHWTAKQRRSTRDRSADIFISKRRDVDYLDVVIGPKC
jgi:hypothetical protein